MSQPLLNRAVLALAFVPAAWLLAPPAAVASPFDLPSLDRIVQYSPKLPLQVFTADGVEIAMMRSGDFATKPALI